MCVYTYMQTWNASKEIVTFRYIWTKKPIPYMTINILNINEHFFSLLYKLQL